MFVWTAQDVVGLALFVLFVVCAGLYVLAGMIGGFVASVRKRFRRGG
jgi:hypothetical protein